MLKPDKYPEWSTVPYFDETTNNWSVEEPEETKKNKGWDYGEPPPREWQNWLALKTYEWIKYLDESTTQNSALYKKVTGMTLTKITNSEFEIYSGTAVGDNGIIFSQTQNYTKNLSLAWTVGNGGGALANGITYTANTWYHIFAIVNNDYTIVDYIADTDINAVNAMLTTGYATYRHIGDLYVDNLSAIRDFIMRETFNERVVLWKLPAVDVQQSFTATVETQVFENYTLMTPPNIETSAIFVPTGIVDASPQSGHLTVYFFNTSQIDPVATDYLKYAQLDALTVDISTSVFFDKSDHTQLEILTDTAARIRALVAYYAPLGITLRIVTSGWKY